VLDHHTLDPGVPIRTLVRRLRASVMVGGLTTMASSFGLRAHSFPGFRGEIGSSPRWGSARRCSVTLSSSGVLSGEPPDRSAPPTRGARLGCVRRRGALARAAPGRTLGRDARLHRALRGVRSALAIRRRLTHLMSLDPGLRSERMRVRARVAREDFRPRIFALGAEPIEAVARTTAVAVRLPPRTRPGRSANSARCTRALGRASSSSATCARSRRSPIWRPRGDGVRGRGLPPGGARAVPALRWPSPRRLRSTPPRCAPRRSPTSSAAAARSRRPRGCVTYLRGGASSSRSRARSPASTNVHVFDQKTFMTRLPRVRITTINQIGVGSGLVVLVLALYYRRLRPALAAFLPSLLVGGAVVAGVSRRSARR